MLLEECKSCPWSLGINKHQSGGCLAMYPLASHEVELVGPIPDDCPRFQEEGIWQ